jgi:hypothetical protein
VCICHCQHKRNRPCIRHSPPLLLTASHNLLFKVYRQPGLPIWASNLHCWQQLLLST